MVGGEALLMRGSVLNRMHKIEQIAPRSMADQCIVMHNCYQSRKLLSNCRVYTSMVNIDDCRVSSGGGGGGCLNLWPTIEYATLASSQVS